MLEAYVYKVTNKITGQFYFGSRTNNIAKGRTPEEDLWKYYFTSSKVIKRLIEEHGIDSFDVEIIHKDIDYAKCFWTEQQLIFENRNNPNRLNKAYVNPKTGKKVLTTFNETEEERKFRAKKISENKKGRFNSNGHFGLKHSDETRKKMRESQQALGYKHSDEVKQKMRNHQRTAEHAEKLGASLRGKPWSEARINAQLKRKNNGNTTV
jgi:hypothetical protein